MGVLVKKLLNLISFPLIPPNNEGNENLRGMSVPSYLFHSLPLRLPNKRMSFPFPPLKLSNKGREEYSKIILFIPFPSISFPPPKQCLSNLD